MKLGRTLVIQSFPGIGDMIWHLPYMRGIAALTPNGKVSVLTKSRSLAKDWLVHDPMIEEIYYAERRGLMAQADVIKEGNFDAVWVLHRSFSYALVAFLAGIKRRYGFGFGFQKYLLNEKKILDEHMRHWHSIRQVQTLLERNKVPYDASDQEIFLPSSIIKRVEKEFSKKGPKIALGIGGSESYKRWRLENFANLMIKLNRLGYRNIYICGGPGEEADASALLEKVKSRNGDALTVTHLPIDSSIALMGICDFYIGNDSGLLNAAVCRGTPALGLFGATPPLTYSPLLHSIIGSSMDAITVDEVVAYFEKHFHGQNFEKEKLNLRSSQL